MGVASFSVPSQVGSRLRNSTISMLVVDHQNGYRYSTIRRRAPMEHENADTLIDELLVMVTDGLGWLCTADCGRSARRSESMIWAG